MEAPTLFPEPGEDWMLRLRDVKDLWTLRSGRPFSVRTCQALALLETKEDSEVGALEHTLHGGLRCAGNANHTPHTPPPPCQAERESQPGIRRGVCVGWHCLGPAEGCSQVCSGKQQGTEHQVEGMEVPTGRYSGAEGRGRDGDSMCGQAGSDIKSLEMAGA